MIFNMYKGGVMTLKHMNIFVRVYQNQSITKAAQELHMVQPAVSIAIKELEKYYGIQLFDRISRHIYPTEHGKRFYQYALHIVSLFDEMETQIKRLGQSRGVPCGQQHHHRYLLSAVENKGISQTLPID